MIFDGVLHFLKIWKKLQYINKPWGIQIHWEKFGAEIILKAVIWRKLRGVPYLLECIAFYGSFILQFMRAFLEIFLISRTMTCDFKGSLCFFCFPLFVHHLFLDKIVFFSNFIVKFQISGLRILVGFPQLVFEFSSIVQDAESKRLL